MRRLSIGIDGGGTHTRVLAQTERGDFLRADGTGSNPRVIGTAETGKVIADLIGQACGNADVDAELFICAGIAGAATPEIQQAVAVTIAESLAPRHIASIRVTDDAMISFEAAYSGSPGILMLVGTGSNILARTLSGRWLRSGGWGYLLGDEGSGYQLGQMGLRAVGRAIDQDADTVLRTLAQTDFDIESRTSLLASVYGGPLRASDFAESVLKAASSGDSESLGILNASIIELVRELQTAVTPVLADLPKTIRLVGGLTKSQTYLEAFHRVVDETLGRDWDIAPAQRRPAEGALWLASRIEK